MKNICVVGGGAAGLMAAYTAAKNGHNVIIFEKNEKLGKKIYITGKGRCNFTNDSAPDDFLMNVVRGKKFLTGVLYSFPPQKTIGFFEEYGMPVKIERGNRAFPVSDHASDVTKTLEKACKLMDVEIHLNEEVQEIKSIMSDIIPTSDVVKSVTMSDIIPMSNVAGARFLIKTQKKEYFFDSVIIATGGLSYPTTGSTGDGYRFAKNYGHTIAELRPGLCGFNIEGTWWKELQGLALKNVSISVKLDNKIIHEDFGEMLFTHFGISGPVVLSASSIINRLALKDVTVFLDLKPALDENTLDKRILRDFEKYKNKQITNALIELLPQKLIPIVLSLCNIDTKKNVNILTKEERFRLVKTLKSLPIKVHSLRGFEEAIITSGGIQLSEINPKTMESKKVEGLYFCGEVLDVDAFTGGFNMQIAFATGYAAGKAI